MNVKFFLLCFIVSTVLFSDEAQTRTSANKSQSAGMIKEPLSASQNRKGDGNTTFSISKTWTATFRDILATMTEPDRKELEGKMKREKFKLDMSDIKYDIYADQKTGATFAVPSGGIVDFTDGARFHSGDAGEAGKDSVQYSVLYTGTSSYREAISAVTHMIEDKFPQKVWKETASSVDTSNHEQSSIAHRYADKINKFGQLYVEVSDTVYLVVSLTYNGYLLDHDPVYLKKFYQYSMAMYMTSFTKN
jgi:hypothetical protein